MADGLHEHEQGHEARKGSDVDVGRSAGGSGCGTWFVHAVTTSGSEDLQASEWIRWTTVTMYLCTVLCIEGYELEGLARGLSQWCESGE